MDTVDEQMEDEKKPFDAEGGADDDAAQPDPDEELMMQSSNGRVWIVKVYTAQYSATRVFTFRC